MAPHSSTLAWKNPRDREAWWAAVYGVAQSRTWLKWLSSSNDQMVVHIVCSCSQLPWQQLAGLQVTAKVMWSTPRDSSYLSLPLSGASGGSSALGGLVLQCHSRDNAREAAFLRFYNILFFALNPFLLKIAHVAPLTWISNDIPFNGFPRPQEWLPNDPCLYYSQSHCYKTQIWPQHSSLKITQDTENKVLSL